MKKKQSNLPACRFCHSKNVVKAGFTTLSEPYRKAQNYQCKDCGKRFYSDPLKQKQPQSTPPPEEETE